MGVLRLGRRAFGRDQLLVMAVVPFADPAAAIERVHAVVAEGADIVEIGGDAALVAAVREAYPDLVAGVSTGSAEVAREACAAGADLIARRRGRPDEPRRRRRPDQQGAGFEVAAEFGAGVVCPLPLAARAVAAGVEPERIIVSVPDVRQLPEVVTAGWPALVSSSDREPTGSLAALAVAGWLGARVFRVDEVLQTRRVLRMVSAIRGDIPPARAVRGLALSRAWPALAGGLER